MGMAVIGTSVPQELKDRFGAYCAARRSDMSKFLRGMIEDELDRAGVDEANKELQAAAEEVKA